MWHGIHAGSKPIASWRATVSMYRTWHGVCKESKPVVSRTYAHWRATDSSPIAVGNRQSAIGDWQNRRLVRLHVRQDVAVAATRTPGCCCCDYTCNWVFSRRFSSALYKCKTILPTIINNYTGMFPVGDTS